MTNQNNAAQAADKELLEAFELTYAADAADPACAADLFHFTNGWRALLSKLRAPVADERALPKWLDVALLRRRAEQASSGEWQALARETSNTFDVHLPNKSPVIHWMGFDGADMSRKQKAANARYIAAAGPRTVLALLDALAGAPVANDVTPAGMKEICPECGHQFGCFHSPYIDKLRAKASAPVSGEALFWYRPRSDGWYEGPIHNDRIEEARKRSGAWVPLVAAPQASAEDDRELRAAAQAFYDASKTVARFAVESLDDRDALVAASVRLRAALSATEPEQGDSKP